MAKKQGIMSQQRFQRSDVIYSSGANVDSAFLVKSGTVSLVDTAHGEPRTVRSVTEGQLFGEECLANLDERMYQAVAADDVVCVAVDKSLLQDQIKNEDPFVSALYRILTANLQSVLTKATETREKALQDIADNLADQDG